ncbi:MAG: L,D-transpeptidase [Beggiatoa sp.]|nr:L,D-transpeptidase [Beggiatoa sp.]
MGSIGLGWLCAGRGGCLGVDPHAARGHRQLRDRDQKIPANLAAQERAARPEELSDRLRARGTGRQAPGRGRGHAGRQLPHRQDQEQQSVSHLPAPQLPEPQRRLPGPARSRDLGIHGIGEITEEKLEIHRTSNWTKGCIALTNDEIDDLMHYIGVGTKVVINE